MTAEDSLSPSQKELTLQFFLRALTNADQVLLEEASRMDGLDGEIAMLRVRLLQLVKEHPEEFKLMLRGLDVLTRLVSARYRMSKKAEHDLSDSMAAMLRGISVQLYPEGIDAA